VDRLFDSCKIYRCEIPYSREDVARAIIDTVKANNLDSCYVRPIVFRGMGQMGVNPLKCPVHLVVAAWSWGKYLGEEAMENGVSVCVSSWRRAAPDTFPTLSKAGGNYLNSQLIKMEALLEGYDEGIALDAQGFVSEGSGENVFVIRNGVIYTPPSNSSILPGLTRHCVFMLARDMNIRVEQHEVQREALYIADEVFFTGTAAEITPVSRIDNIVIGCGKRGPITEKIQSAFFAIVEGRAPDKFGWLTPVA
jgi:branched-chain amino acid aminotransferase